MKWVFLFWPKQWFKPKCDVYMWKKHRVYELNLAPVDFELDSKKAVDNFLSSKHDAIEFGSNIVHYKSIFSHY